MISGTAAVTLDNLKVTGNQARSHGSGSGMGGAIAVMNGAVLTLRGGLLAGNIANGATGDGYGGGIAALHSTVTITASTFQSNRTQPADAGVRQGGGIYLVDSPLTLARSILTDNHAQAGAAIFAQNSATGNGQLDLTNSWIVSNEGVHSLYIDQANPARIDSLRHLTLVGNGSGIGLNVVDGSTTVINTLVTGFTVGVNNGGGSMTEAYSLLADNGVNRTGLVNSSNPVGGSPRFVDASAGDYHLREDSDAIDQGTDAGVVDDLDGEARDAAPDVGADEFTEVPITQLEIQSDPAVIIDRTLIFTAQISTGTNVSYIWRYGDGEVGTGRVVSHSFDAVGGYRVVVTATNPLTTAAAAKNIRVLPRPLTGATASNDGPKLAGAPVHFSAVVSGGVGITFTWDFGDGQTGSGVTTTHSYPRSGIYTATVTAANPTNQVSATTRVLVGDALVTVLENEFSPRLVTVPAGGWVVWRLAAGTHSVTADDGSFAQPRGDDWPPFAHRFDGAGIHRYYSDVLGAPGGVGMAGVVNVEGPLRRFLPSLQHTPATATD